MLFCIDSMCIKGLALCISDTNYEFCNADNRQCVSLYKVHMCLWQSMIKELNLDTHRLAFFDSGGGEIRT